MKKLSIIFLSGFFALLIFGNFSADSKQAEQIEKNTQTGLPENISKIVENSCYGCHNSESRNEDAKTELSFDKWNDLNTLKKIGKLKKIHETVSKGEMPPKRFLERFPERKLSEDEVKVLTEWAKKEME